MKKTNYKFLSLLLLLFTSTSCNIVITNNGTSKTSSSSTSIIDSSSTIDLYLYITNDPTEKIYVNEDYQLTLNTNINKEEITFISDNEYIATVDKKGIVHPTSIGNVTIYAVHNKISTKITLEVIKREIEFEINESQTIFLQVNGTRQINFTVSYTKDNPTWSSSNENVCTIDSNGLINGLSVGTSTITGTLGNIERTIEVEVLKESDNEFSIYIDNDTFGITEESNLISTYSFETSNKPTYYINQRETVIKLTDENTVIGLNPGTASIYAILDNMISNTLSITISDTDPYTNVNTTTFYNNYSKAISYSDAKYRSNHYLMSGSIEEQDQDPTISNQRPIEDDKYVRNTTYNFLDSDNTYAVLDYSGNITNYIYKDGAYTTLEEVAAYVMAFGDIPKNYTSNKSANPSQNSWGKYLRLNHSYFTCNTTNYPFEPLLPNAVKYSTNGDLYYYEIDIGTTGTDCDPKYTPVNYNTGTRITRGAARIVYARYKGNDGNTISNLNDRYVFYTNNHYNDFREYLNYENGWGEIFGNITGGGTISSKTNYNPTPYVESIQKGL